MYHWKEDEVVDCVLDKEKRNRYSLTCTWDKKKSAVTFLMLNPSTGNMERANPTLRKCVSFARSWGFGSMNVVNLFSHITPHPEKLRAYTPTEVEIAENRRHVKKAVEAADKVVLAWGTIAAPFKEQVAKKIALVPAEKRFCITKTKHGFPGHPLFLKNDLQPIRFTNELSKSYGEIKK